MEGPSSSSDLEQDGDVPVHSVRRNLFNEGVERLLPDEMMVTPHQPSLPLTPPMEEYWLPTDAERDALERAHVGTLPKPRLPAVPETWTIAQYFDATAVPVRKRISICRSYATYLNALEPAPKRNKSKK